jgi:hypothetical protein
MCGARHRAIAIALTLGAAGLGGAPPAAAEASSVGRGEGGYVPDFLSIIRRHNASGETFRIKGVCKSACTMFLGIRNVCVERSATLMFHAGHDIAENVTGPDTRASRAALYRYNEALRRYLLDGHHMDTDAFHSLSGSAIIDRFGYHECPPKQ